MTQVERQRIERRIAKAKRRLARGIDLRVEKLHGPVRESEVIARLETLLNTK